MADTGRCDRRLFRKIDQLMREDNTRVLSGFDKAAAFINGLFCDLASIDVRFEFDPVSLDDCRCERITLNEFNLMCTLKHLPYEEMSLEGSEKSGAVKVRLADSYSDSYDKACWEDVCSSNPLGKRYLDTNKIRLALLRAIKTILSCENQEGASIFCQSRFGFLTVIVNLHLNGVYKFNLLPAMWVSRKCLALKKFNERIAQVFHTIDDTDSVECIQIVCRPTPALPHTFWRITFNDLENRILNLHKFSCVQHCIFAVHSLQKRYLVANNSPSLSLYNIRLVALREVLRTPEPKEWGSEKFAIRLDSLFKSIKTALNNKNSNNVFTHVNVLENSHKKVLKFLCREFGQLRKFHQEMILFLS